jgi:endonuclease/exonuclease/phosphatase family metal-dependent hydrolase
VSRRERIAERLAMLAPDILCATEADRQILPAGGHDAQCEPDSGYGVRGGRRKVILWSRWPLEDVDPVGAPGLPPGRFVAATCRTPLGPLRLTGVCIPWRDAHVRTGRKDRAQWQEHLEYLAALESIIAGRDRRLPALLLGDFNQRVPRRRAPIRVAEALRRALGDLIVATGGELPGIGRQVIDHVARSPSVAVGEIRAVDRRGADGRPLSDHDAVVVGVVGLS